MVPKTDISVSDFKIKNEPVLGYLPGSKERSDLEAAINKYSDVTEDVPIVIGGKEYRTDQVHYQPMVHIFQNTSPPHPSRNTVTNIMKAETRTRPIIHIFARNENLHAL